ncbi:MAG: hypothetical protein ACI4S2_03570 [Lachnospiraceae bacterium]
MKEISQAKLIEQIAVLYGELYKKMADNESFSVSDEHGKAVDVSFKELSHFTSMQGKNYGKTVKFLLIGRAVNGWMSMPSQEKEQFEQATDLNLRTHGFSWIRQNESGKLCNEDGSYCLNRSSFWRTSEEIWKEISGWNAHEITPWFESIAWTNLYKIAPPYSGNPNTKMIKQEREICREILKLEIELYDPEYVLFVTGWDWFCEFWQGEANADGLLSEKVERNTKTNGIYAEKSFTYAGRKFVISCRPETRPENEYKIDICKSFKDL